MRLVIALVDNKSNQVLLEWKEEEFRNRLNKKIFPFFTRKKHLIEAFDLVVEDLKNESHKIP